ncbi:hypothetical protein CDG77_33550 [Nostoc sp. 'Peltigera membranacea cyanobiont' 213]|nr:hypothetical protein CDG77_33550 [Nostoc sp. 'Peltigera membranacea cyanobiont' 213]
MKTFYVQGEGIAVVERTSPVLSLIAVCSQSGHLTLIWMIEGRPLFSPTTGSLINLQSIPVAVLVLKI